MLVSGGIDTQLCLLPIDDFALASPEGFDVKLDGAYLRPEPGAQRDGYFAAVLRRKEGGWSR